MSSDVAERAAGAATGGIGAPLCLLLSRFFQWSREPILHVFNLDYSESAEVACSHHFARLTDHGVARVIVGQAEYKSSSLYDRSQVQRVFGRGG